MDFATAIAQTCAGLERQPDKGAATFTADHALTGLTEVDAAISGPESSDRYDELYKAVEAHCPVQDIVTNGVPVTSELTVTAS